MPTIEFKPLRITEETPASELEPFEMSASASLFFGILLVVPSIVSPFILQFTYPESPFLSNPLRPVFLIIFIVLGTIYLMSGIQMRHGVSIYRFDGRSIIIPHAIGSTRIPIDVIEGVSVDRLVRNFREVSTKKGIRKIAYYVDSSGNPVKTNRGHIPYGWAPFVTCSGGSCLLVKLKDKSLSLSLALSLQSSRIALTPENPEAMVQLLRERIGMAARS